MATFHRRKPKTNVAQFPRNPRAIPSVSANLAKPKRRRGIYLLPNAFTTAALFSGFFAIVQAMNQRFETAAYAIFIAAVLDSLDGRVARLTNTQSDFGAEYDSLSDMVAFGVAPALVIYQWSLLGLGKWGWLAAFVYVAGAGLRLARFNTNIEVIDKRFFQGLPSPAAAAMVAGFVLVLDSLRYTGAELMWQSFVVTLYAGLSMVSNSPFYSFKVVNLRKSVPFVYALGIVLLFVVILINPPRVLFASCIAYALSGHLLWLWRHFRRGRTPVAAAPTEGG
ncbi:MAG: CDP-diacylglycerol--serine O-phosphatidyltransferase [Burkholderiaceae bacterium]|jgi:CDP-diacylglycerol--serine O-phosphatidyltransferase